MLVLNVEGEELTAQELGCKLKLKDQHAVVTRTLWTYMYNVDITTTNNHTLQCQTLLHQEP